MQQVESQLNDMNLHKLFNTPVIKLIYYLDVDRVFNYRRQMYTNNIFVFSTSKIYLIEI